MKLTLQVYSYRGKVDLKFSGDADPMFTVQDGRCVECGCSSFRHELSPLAPRCNGCPTNSMRAINSADLVRLTMPQVCFPGTRSRGDILRSGPVTLEIQHPTLDAPIRMESPLVTWPRLSGPVTRASKGLLYEMQDKRCNACFERRQYNDLSYDHRTPRVRLGEKTIENAELMCGPCNNEKGSQDMFEFLYERWKHKLCLLVREALRNPALAFWT